MDSVKTPAGASDRERIHLNDLGELSEWAKKLDATAEQIREAVQAVGNLAADVEMHLKGSHATTNADQAARGDAAVTPD